MATSKKKSVVISAATVKQALTPEQAFAAEAELAITTAIQAMTPADQATQKVLQALSPSATAMNVVSEFSALGGLDPQTLFNQLTEHCADVRNNGMGRMESMLVAQAYSLNAIFAKLAMRAARNDDIQRMETLLRVGLRAQSQCRATLETLAAIKNPGVVFAKQANFAAGHQQVNNQAPAATRTGKSKKPPIKLLEIARG
jgi:hypothetical protein